MDWHRGSGANFKQPNTSFCMIWKPNVTVAAVVEQNGRFLLVEEEAGGGLVLNQPAGHLDEGESLLDAVVRETLEETAYHFVPAELLGIYRWRSPASGVTYVRFAFTGTVTGHEPQRVLDDGIVRVLWLSPEDCRADGTRHRSPQVQRCIDDYLRGERYPLALLKDMAF